MAAPRATLFLALRNLTRTQQVRHLHMTGPTTYASQLLTQERPVSNLPRDIAGLRAECKRRKIDTTGTQQDLLARLNADDLTHSRAFSTASASSSRPTTTPPTSATTVRHFNISRQLKAVGDSSTIDFAYLPADALAGVEEDEVFRVPILPNNYTNSSSSAVSDDDGIVLRPEISTMSADAVFLPMSDMSDGHTMNIDFHAMADRVAANLKRMSVPVDQQAGVMKQIWSDLVDDMIAVAQKKPAVRHWLD